MSRMKHLLRKLHLSGDPPPPPPTSPPPTLPPPPPPPPPPPAVSHSNFRFKERENEAMTRFEEEYQVQLAMAISQSDPDGLEDPDSVQIKAAKQISLAVGGGDMGGLEMEMLSLRYWNYNVVNYDEKIKDGFYDLYGTTSNSKLQVQVPTLLDLQSLSISQSMDFEAILVNRTLDPSLQQLEQKAQQILLNNNNNNINNNNYEGLVREIAGIVVNYMGGTVEDTEEMQIKWYQKCLDLKIEINSCVIPLGLVDLGLSRHRALLFKVLADKLGLPCKLVRGGYYTGTDDGAVNFVKIDSHSEYMVDLMGAPGTLIPAEVPTNYFQNTENTPGSCSIITTQEEDNNSIQYLAPNNITQNNEHIPDLMSSTLILQNPENIPQLIESIENISKQEMQVNDVSKCLVTASRDPLFAGKLHAVLSENDASFPACFFSDIIEKGKDLESGGHGCDILEGPGCDTGKVGGQSENVVIGDVEMEIGWEELRVGERIGLGSYGEVYRADWHGTEVAVKKFLDQDLSGYALDQFRFEVTIMSRLRHPNIVLFMGAVTRPPNLSILTEFLPRGSLYRLLHRPNAPLDEKRRLKMAIDVARGMNYLHTSHPTIVHRDLKTPNLLVDKNWVVKVSDFGLSRLKHNTFLSSKSSGGTPEWMAPEVLRNEPSNEKCDVYSYGVILWELATMQMPWSGLNPMQVVGAVGFQNKRLEIPAYVHPDVADIINSCFDDDPSKRPSFAQLMFPLKQLEHLVI